MPYGNLLHAEWRMHLEMRASVSVEMIEDHYCRDLSCDTGFYGSPVTNTG